MDLDEIVNKIVGYRNEVARLQRGWQSEAEAHAATKARVAELEGQLEGLQEAAQAPQAAPAPKAE